MPSSSSPAAGFQVVTASNSSALTLQGTNTYLLGGPHTIVVDPGPDEPAHVTRVLDIARGGGQRVALILVTHSHSDHLGGAERLARLSGAQVGRWKAGDRPLRDGDLVAVGDVRLRVLHTPGHAPDHVVFVWEDRRVLFSGDLILGSGTVVVRPPTGSMEDYIRSLERVARLDLALIAPGHGPFVSAPAERVAEYMAHRRQREQQVLESLGGGPRTPAEIAAVIYTDLAPQLHPEAEGQVHAHLLKLIAEGRVRREGNRYYLP
jgi:glyoxylase-like metal-dependent hydrolase (beta-lactamase superfamily II)